MTGSGPEDWFAGAFRTLGSRRACGVLGGSRDEAVRGVLASEWEVRAHARRGPVPDCVPTRNPEVRLGIAVDAYVLQHRSRGPWALLAPRDYYTSAGEPLTGDWDSRSLEERRRRLMVALLGTRLCAPSLPDLLDAGAPQGDRTGAIRAALLSVPGGDGDAVRLLCALQPPA